MKYIFSLSGDYIDLAKEEIISLFEVKNYKVIERLLIVDLKIDINSLNKLSKRLALTRNIYKLLFECKFSELIDEMKNYNWNSIYNDNFCLRIHNLSNKLVKNNEKNSKTTIKNNEKISNKKTRTTSESIGDRSKPLLISSEKSLAKYIWRSVKKPKVNLENPKTKIEVFFVKNKVYCGLLMWENKEDFESRKAHLRPFPSPSSLHPKLARALVNITSIKENEILLDSFCGTGGFLIEAGLMGIKVVGHDINKIMVKGCIENLKHYKIKNYKIKNQNALRINDKFDCLVTDLPYGLNSNAIIKLYEKDWKKGRLNLKVQKKGFYKNLENFYFKFLKMLRKKLKSEKIKNFFDNESAKIPKGFLAPEKQSFSRNSKNFRWKKAVIVFPDYVNYKKITKDSKFKIEKELSSYVHRSLTRKIVLLRVL